MEIKRLLLIMLGWTMTINIMAQSFTLRGKVMDQNMNPVELAMVSCAKQGKFTMTSLEGEYTLQLHSSDSVIIRFSMVGYKTKTRVLQHPRGRQMLQIMLYSDNTLDEVKVEGEHIQTGQNQELKTKDMKTMASANGNAIEALVQSQAGVSTHSELSSQYNVRGGAFDENLVYINNVEIYRPFLVRSGQQEGLSIINPYMVDKIKFSTGGFAAKYGDKMSSALDITYKDLEPKAGNKSIFEGNIAASLLGAEAYVGIANKKVSWLNSIRYKTNKNLLSSLETNGEYHPNFLDYQTYLNYHPNTQWNIDFIGNINDNHYNFIPKTRETSFGTLENVKSFKVYFDGQEKDRFLTYFGTIGITRNLNKNTSLSLIGSGFYTKEQEKYDIQGQYWLDQTETSENLGVGTYFQHARNYLTARVLSTKFMLKHKNKQHEAEVGITFKKEHIEEQSDEYEMRDSSGYSIPHTGQDLYMIYSLKASNTLDANRIEAYAQDTYHFASQGEHTHFTLNYGIRMSHWNFNKETIISPRISIGIIPPYSENTTFRIAGGLYYQAPFFKELRDTSTVNGITNVSLNNKIKSQQSLQLILGYDYRFQMNNQRFRFSSEAYYKALRNLIPYSINNVQVIYYGDNKATGHAMGIDMKLYGEFVPNTDSWLSFSLMNTQMKFNGKTMPLPTDQKFSFNLFFTDYFPGTDRWKVGLKLAYADGLPFSAPHQEFERNSFRAPAYKRVDLGISYCLLNNSNHEKKNIFKSIWLSLDCLNLFGISNVNSYFWITDVTNQQYAVPNYLTGRQLNGRLVFDF
ncbi:MAG TPA: TonB-dependent receptor [Prevotella sp.]|nr:TonB-dependent receptor [Prevotella sp.]